MIYRDLGNLYLLSKILVAMLGTLLIALMICLEALVLGLEIMVEPHSWIYIELLSF